MSGSSRGNRGDVAFIVLCGCIALPLVIGVWWGASKSPGHAAWFEIGHAANCAF